MTDVSPLKCKTECTWGTFFHLHFPFLVPQSALSWKRVSGILCHKTIWKPDVIPENGDTFIIWCINEGVNKHKHVQHNFIFIYNFLLRHWYKICSGVKDLTLKFPFSWLTLQICALLFVSEVLENKKMFSSSANHIMSLHLAQNWENTIVTLMKIVFCCFWHVLVTPFWLWGTFIKNKLSSKVHFWVLLMLSIYF